MKKKMRLTKISNDEMKEAKAGADSGPGGCYCHCSCWEQSDGISTGYSEFDWWDLTGGTSAELPHNPCD